MSNIPSSLPRPKSYIQSTSPTKYNAISSPPGSHLPAGDSRSKIRAESQLGWSPLRIQKRADSPTKDNLEGGGEVSPLSGGPSVPTGDRRTSSSYKHLKTNSLVSNSPFKSPTGGPLAPVSPQQRQDAPLPPRPSPQRKVPVGLGISSNPAHNVPSSLIALANAALPKSTPNKKRSSSSEMRIVVAPSSTAEGNENERYHGEDEDGNESTDHVEVNHSFNPPSANHHNQSRASTLIWNQQETKRRQSAGLVQLPKRSAVSNSPFLRSPSTPSSGGEDVFSDESGINERLNRMGHAGADRDHVGSTTEDEESEGNMFSSPEEGVTNAHQQPHLQRQQSHEDFHPSDDEGPTPPPAPTTPPSTFSSLSTPQPPVATQHQSYTYHPTSPPQQQQPQQGAQLAVRSSLKSRRLRGPRHSAERAGVASNRPRAKTVTFNEMKDVLEFDRDTSVEYGSEDDALGMYDEDDDSVGGMDYYYEDDDDEMGGHDGNDDSSEFLEEQFEGMGMFDSNEGMMGEETGVYGQAQRYDTQQQSRHQQEEEDDLEEVQLDGLGGQEDSIQDISFDDVTLASTLSNIPAPVPIEISTSTSAQHIPSYSQQPQQQPHTQPQRPGELEVRSMSNGPHLPRKVSNTSFSEIQKEREMEAQVAPQPQLPTSASNNELSRPALVTRRSESFGDQFQLEKMASLSSSRDSIPAPEVPALSAPHSANNLNNSTSSRSLHRQEQVDKQPVQLDIPFSLPSVGQTSPMFAGLELPQITPSASLPTRPSSYTLSSASSTSSRRTSTSPTEATASSSQPQQRAPSPLAASSSTPADATRVTTRSPKKGYRVVERPTTYYSGADRDGERIMHDGQAGDLDKGGKAWRSVRRASDMNQYAEEIRQIRSSEKPGKQHSKVFVKIVKISDMDIPMPSETTKFSCRLNNGLHCVDTQTYPFGSSAEMGTEFELLGLENLEFTLAIRIRRDPHILARAKALMMPKAIEPSIAPSKAGHNRFSKVFGSPKKPKATISRSATPVVSPEALKDDLVRYLSTDGTLGQAKLVYRTIASKCMGEHLTLDLPLSAKWNEESVAQARRMGRSGSEMQRTIGRIQLQVMAIPALPGLTQDQMPQSMEDALQGLRNLKWHKMDFHAGELNQLGGDCSSWRRRKYRLIGATLEATSTSTNKVISRIDLTILSAIRDNNGPNQRRDDMASSVDKSFTLVFVDGDEIQFYADEDEEKEKWMSLLGQLVGVQIPTLPLWAEMYWVKQQADDLQLAQHEKPPPVPEK